MVIEGLKLMVLGMTIVIVFLAFLYIIVTLLGFLLRSSTQAELTSKIQKVNKMPAIKAKGNNITSPDLLEDSRLVATITAAIACHRRNISP